MTVPHPFTFSARASYVGGLYAKYASPTCWNVIGDTGAGAGAGGSTARGGDRCAAEAARTGEGDGGSGDGRGGSGGGFMAAGGTVAPQMRSVTPVRGAPGSLITPRLSAMSFSSATPASCATLDR